MYTRKISQQLGIAIQRISPKFRFTKKNWRLFLQVNNSNTEVFRYLSESVITATSDDMNVFCAFLTQLLEINNIILAWRLHIVSKRVSEHTFVKVRTVCNAVIASR